MINFDSKDMQTIVRGLHCMLDMQELGYTDDEAGGDALALMDKLNKSGASSGVFASGDEVAIISNLVTRAMESERYLIERPRLMEMYRTLYKYNYSE